MEVDFNVSIKISTVHELLLSGPEAFLYVQTKAVLEACRKLLPEAPGQSFCKRIFWSCWINIIHTSSRIPWNERTHGQNEVETKKRQRNYMTYTIFFRPSPQPTTAWASRPCIPSTSLSPCMDAWICCSSCRMLWRPSSTSGSQSRPQTLNCFCPGRSDFFSSFFLYSSSVTLTGLMSLLSCSWTPRCSLRLALVTWNSFRSSCSCRNFRATCSRFLELDSKLTC